MNIGEAGWEEAYLKMCKETHERADAQALAREAFTLMLVLTLNRNVPDWDRLETSAFGQRRLV